MCRDLDKADQSNNIIRLILISALLGLIASATGCKIKINVPDGGTVTTKSGNYNCYSGQNCTIEVDDTRFNETFIAMPDTGYRFTGWRTRPNGLCGGKTTPCRLHTREFKDHEKLISLLESDQRFYLVPTFQVAGSGCLKERSFQFEEITDANLGWTYATREVSVGPLCEGRMIGIGNVGDFRAVYSIDGGLWSSGVREIKAHQKIRIKMDAAPTFDTTREALLTIGEPECIIFVTTECNWILQGGYSEFKITTKPGNPANAPQVIITYPTDGDVVAGTALEVSGTATDKQGVHEITVNGVAATSNDGFLTWQATVPLYTGENEIVVSSADKLLNRNPSAAQISVFNDYIVVTQARSIFMGNNSSTLYVLDMERGEIVAIASHTNDWRIVAEEEDSTLPFIDPRRLVVNRAETLAWVLDKGYEDIIEIDLESGERSLLGSTGYPLTDMKDLALDEKRKQLLALAEDSGITTNSTIRSGRIIAIDLPTRQRTLLSSTETTGGDAIFFITYGIHMDSVLDRLLLFQRNSILTINPKTGKRKALLEFNALMPRAVTVDEAGGNILVGRADWDSPVFRLLSVDTADGEYRELPYEYGTIPGNARLAYDPMMNRLFFTNYGHIGVIDLDTWRVTEQLY